jgi:hypothetical protein
MGLGPGPHFRGGPQNLARRNKKRNSTENYLQIIRREERNGLSYTLFIMKCHYFFIPQPHTP